MGKGLDGAAKAHRAALAALAAAQADAKARVEAARQRVADSRAALADEIVAEANAGTPQNEIMRRSGYSREQVRTILRANGVGPDPP